MWSGFARIRYEKTRLVLLFKEDLPRRVCEVGWARCWSADCVSVGQFAVYGGAFCVQGQVVDVPQAVERTSFIRTSLAGIEHPLAAVMPVCPCDAKSRIESVVRIQLKGLIGRDLETCIYAIEVDLDIQVVARVVDVPGVTLAICAPE